MKLKDKMLMLGLSPKQEYSILIVGNLVFFLASLACFVFLKSAVYAGMCIGVEFIFTALFLTRYGSKIDHINNENLQDFTNLFSYFKIYIRNGYSVYSALKEISVFANENLEKLLTILINEIDSDKTVRPFVKFAKNFNEVIVEEMMISIYQMIDDGEQSDYLIQFEMIFDKFSDSLYQKNLHKKDSKLGTLGSAPLLGSCFLIVVLTIGVMDALGGMINGI